MTSPTQRSLAYLRKEGWTAQVVEKWNAYGKVRVDLFGCIDIVALRAGIILGIQATSGSHVSHRVEKSLNTPGLKQWLLAGGRFEVWGWRKAGKRGQRKTWQLRKVRLKLEDLK